jgi:hypothetical protein
MHYLTLALRAAGLLILATTLSFLAFHYMPASPGYAPPLHVWLIDTVNLIIHESGHFFFLWLGSTIGILGGSLMQILLPAGITVFVWRRFRGATVLPLFWTGWNMMHVAVYVSDAPFRALHLIGRGLKHDWHELMLRFGLMDQAVTIGALLHWCGVLVCLGALAHGVFVTLRLFRSGDDGRWELRRQE